MSSGEKQSHKMAGETEAGVYHLNPLIDTKLEPAFLLDFPVMSAK